LIDDLIGLIDLIDGLIDSSIHGTPEGTQRAHTGTQEAPRGTQATQDTPGDLEHRKCYTSLPKCKKNITMLFYVRVWTVGVTSTLNYNRNAPRQQGRSGALAQVAFPNTVRTPTVSTQFGE